MTAEGEKRWTDGYVLPPSIQAMADVYGPCSELCMVDEGRLLLLARGELSQVETEELEAHIAGCGKCREDMEDYRAMLDPEFIAEMDSLVDTILSANRVAKNADDMREGGK